MLVSLVKGCWNSKSYHVGAVYRKVISLASWRKII